ncbi:hypothetical protein OYC64_010110 [Pagothenia borchgrevinki]|uniref:C2H2-type domain-containing protein n=1 Tax=Pagothenia borchgrevinki TaxID=8213 RepID=A0ABD2H818_PAGBO
MLTECPLCRMQYRALQRHLVVRHLVLNKDERNILLRMSNGRINIRLEPCSVVGCSYHGTRLDRHIDCAHPELSQKEADLVLQELKRKTGLKMLKELREIDLPVQMITTLDVEDGAHDEHPDSFSGEVGLEADEHRLLRLGNVALVAQTDALNKEVFFLRNKLKPWKASSAKRDLRSSLESPPAERITFQQPERPASSGRRASVATGRHTPLVEFGRPQSKDADDEESRGEGLRRPMPAPPQCKPNRLL